MTIDAELRETLRRQADRIEVDGTPGPSRTSRSPAGIPRLVTIVVALVVAAAAISFSVVSLRHRGDEGAADVPAGATSGSFHYVPPTPRQAPPFGALVTVGVVTVPGAPGGVAVSGRDGWIAVQGQDGAASGVAFIDGNGDEPTVSGFVELGSPLESLQADAGGAWGIEYQGTHPPYAPSLVRIDADDLEVHVMPELDGPVVLDGAGVWVTRRVEAGGWRLVHVDEASLEIDAEFALPTSVRDGVATTTGLWFTDMMAGELFSVDPRTGSIEDRLDLPAGVMASNPVSDGRTVWSVLTPAKAGEPSLVQIDEAGNASMVTIPDGVAIGSSLDGTWLLTELGDVLVVDDKGEVVGRDGVGELPAQVAMEPTASLEPDADRIMISTSTDRVLVLGIS
jgi:hypothetical protein